MKRIRSCLILDLILIISYACQVKIPGLTPSMDQRSPAATSQAVTASPVDTDTNVPITQTPTLKKTPRPSPTITAIPSQTPEPLGGGIAGEGLCVPLNESISITEEIFEDPTFKERIAEFLNEGGSPKILENQLGSDESALDPNLIQVTQKDINLDGIPDLIMTITLPLLNEFGESHVLVYLCQDGQYQGEILFRRAGAGARGEGLYAGGGARIEKLEDLNQDGHIEILFSVNWSDYAEYYLLSWKDGGFVSLIDYMDVLGNKVVFLAVDPGNVNVEDLDGDGIYELIVTAIDDRTLEEETKTWFWDGVNYRPSEE